MTPFRIATYNVHKCKGIDWRVSPARIAEVMACLHAEIVGTQEILLSQAEEISRRLDVPFTFGAARQHAGEPYGNAVFSRWPVLANRNYDLTVAGREERQALRVSLTASSGRPLHFFALHLGTSFSERRVQARKLLSGEVLLAPEVAGRRMIAGDFNEWTRGLATEMLSQEFKSADLLMHLKRSRTYPGVLPFLHLDHVYYDSDFLLRELHLDSSKLALRASDHLPLVAVFSEA
jgi:endonuclease/exonuclease/phosphatase family metal-dependent hydrolase